jgi:hypothetical protein
MGLLILSGLFTTREINSRKLDARPSAGRRRAHHLRVKAGAGDGIRTRDIDLGKVALYQLSYSRTLETIHFPTFRVVLSIVLYDYL